MGSRGDVDESAGDLDPEGSPLEERDHEAGARIELDLRTVEALVELGVEPETAALAVADGRVALVLATKVLAEVAPYTIEDLVEASSVPVHVLVDLLGGSRAAYTQSDLEAAHMFSELLAIFPIDALLRSARTRSMAISAIVRADVSLVRSQVMMPLREAGADDLTVAVALSENAAEFDRISRRMLTFEYRRQLRQTLASELSALAVQSDGKEVEAAVGFVDLVGYTALAARVDPHGLDDLLDAFEQRVVDAASGSDQVTVVKFLGDAAMFVSHDLHQLIDVLLRLVTPTGEDDEVPIRGGIARGPVLAREGDYFGTPVNVAARLTDIARPWSLLADEVLRDELREGYATKRIRPVSVRGLGHRRPINVRAAFDVLPMEGETST